MQYAKGILNLIHEAAVSFGRDKGPLLAAALAYYTILSLAPLLVVSVAVAGLVFGEAAVEGQLVEQIEGAVGREVAITLQRIVENAAEVNTSSVVATVSSVVFLFLGASGVFGQLKTALNMVWGIRREPKQGFRAVIKMRFLAFLMVLGIGVLLLASVAMSVILTSLSGYLANLTPGFGAMLPRLDLAIGLVVVTVGFAIIYRVLPDAEVAWRDVWLGAAVTAFLFALGEYLIGFYLAYSSVGSAYGAAGSLLVILTWIYYSALILMFGAEFTKIYANTYGSKIRPSDNARLIPHLPPQESRRQAPQQLQVAYPALQRMRPVEVPPRSDQSLRQIAAALIGMSIGLLLAVIGNWWRKD